MKITVENKCPDMFDIRIEGLDMEGDDYHDIMEHVISRLDNYYDANGLQDVFLSFDDGIVIAVLWNEEYPVPFDEDLVENVSRWIGEVR